LQGPVIQGARVLRGGSWNNNQNNARCAARNTNNPNNSNNNIGFRLASHGL
jgi:formylglycine-generating enzyme required for sulfatase activity